MQPGSHDQTVRGAGRLRTLLAIALGSLLALVPGLALAHFWAVVPQCDNPYSNPYFFPGGLASDWYVHAYAGSPGGCHWYTHTVTSSVPQNDASWYLPISTNYNHSYNLHEFVPCDSHSSAHSGQWRRFENGSGGGYVTVTRSIDGYCDSYMNPDNHIYNGSNGGYIKMVDNTGAGFYISADYLYYQQ